MVIIEEPETNNNINRQTYKVFTDSSILLAFLALQDDASQHSVVSHIIKNNIHRYATELKLDEKQKNSFLLFALHTYIASRKLHLNQVPIEPYNNY